MIPLRVGVRTGGELDPVYSSTVTVWYKLRPLI